MSLRFPNLDAEHNCQRWDMALIDGEVIPIPVPRDCACGAVALYGAGGKWYCLRCWLARDATL